eukprot:3759949-Amphidinium_carterae.1
MAQSEGRGKKWNFREYTAATVTEGLVRISKLEYPQRIAGILRIFNSNELDDFIAAKTMALLRQHHDFLMQDQPALDHYNEARAWASRAAPRSTVSTHAP